MKILKFMAMTALLINDQQIIASEGPKESQRTVSGSSQRFLGLDVNEGLDIQTILNASRDHLDNLYVNFGTFTHNAYKRGTSKDIYDELRYFFYWINARKLAEDESIEWLKNEIELGLNSVKNFHSTRPEDTSVIIRQKTIIAIYRHFLYKKLKQAEQEKK